MMSINLSNIIILNIHGVDYTCIINEISKSKAISLLQNIDLNEKMETTKLKKNKKYT